MAQLSFFPRVIIHSIIVSLVVCFIHTLLFPQQTRLTSLFGGPPAVLQPLRSKLTLIAGTRKRTTEDAPVLAWLIEAPFWASIQVGIWVLILVIIQIIIFLDSVSAFIIDLVSIKHNPATRPKS